MSSSTISSPDCLKIVKKCERFFFHLYYCNSGTHFRALVLYIKVNIERGFTRSMEDALVCTKKSKATAAIPTRYISLSIKI